MKENVLNYLEYAAQIDGGKIAVADQDQKYSFFELMYLSKRIGACLKKYGQNTPIGVFVDRRADTMAMFFGVLYSGNFYIPLDASMPGDKLCKIIDNSGMRAILGKDSDRAYAESFGMVDFVTLKDITDEICEIPAVGGDDPLYMVYTSGSTGIPKGVLKSHRAEISFIETYCKTFEFGKEDVIGNQTPFSFDASGKDIYLMLKSRATLEILPSELFSFPPMLIRYMNERKVSFISWVPSALCIITQLNTFKEVLPETLKRVFFVGETFPMKQFLKWQQALPDIEYVNLYGASEIAGISCFYKVSGDVSSYNVLPIGKPMDNCTVFLMDQGQMILEPDKPGEIYVISDALASGYYQDQEKTDAAFIHMDGQRVFKSGDIAWYDHDGNLNFAARNDSQIKHMGYRIELGEIEALAGKIDQIERCCCLYNAEKKRIVLFCQLAAGCEADVKTIRSELAKYLTDYMMPQRIKIKDRLPLNANGKIDRQMLKLEI